MSNQLLGWIACLCLGLIAPAALTQAAETAAIPGLPAGLLVDQAGALGEAERAALEGRLRAVQASGRAQVAMLISGGIQGEPLEQYSLRVAESWKLGRAGRDDGLLVLVIPSVPAARIEVGYGLEHAIPDARASQWLDDLLPAMKRGEIAGGLNQLLDRIDSALPGTEAKAASRNPFDAHPEWGLPFVLVVFSPFAIFPMFAGRWGSVASGPLLAAFLGGAAWMMWDSETAGYAVGAAALPLPFLWGLNWYGGDHLAGWLRFLRALGNLVAVTLFFCIITLFVGVGLWAGEVEQIWAAPVFAGLLATGLAVLLFPGKPAHYLMIGLRSAMLFVFILVVAWVALGPFTPHAGNIAFSAAGFVTACASLGLYLDDREQARAPSGQEGGTRWSLWFYGLAMLAALPFMLLALVLAVVGDDLQTQLLQAAAGGGSLTGLLWLAARLGLFTAVKVGLGGLFGGGGAGRSH